MDAVEVLVKCILAPKIVGFEELHLVMIFQRGHALMDGRGQRVINESGTGLAHFE